jgi:2-hydroxycyclohexanecarboxyl-CoA dehydrogenase
MSNPYSLEGKRVIVTGAGSGMGQATAVHAVADGAAVALFDISEKGLAQTLEMLPDGANATTHCCDLTSWEEVETAVGKAIGALGGLDAVCNVAGGDAPAPFWEQTLEYWHSLIDMNLWSTLHMCRATVPTLMEQKSGRIVNVASDAGRVGSKGEVVYSAAKGGVIALTKSLARELAPYTVGVNCVSPGPTRTGAWFHAEKTIPKLLEALVRSIPLRRPAEPHEQAQAIAFFASDASLYITGQVLSVSGGLNMAD